MNKTQREIQEMDRKEAAADAVFDSAAWSDDDPRPSEEACHILAAEMIEYFDPLSGEHDPR